MNLRPPAVASFANFHVAPSNAAAVTMLRARDRWPAPAILLLGPTGSGKSHLGEAFAATEEGQFIDDAEGWPEDTLFYTINQALSGEIAGLLLASATPPTAWDLQMPDLRSRMNAMPVIHLSEHDEATLEPILRELFEQVGRQVSADVVDFMLRNTERSVDALRVLVHELDIAAGSAKADLTKKFVSKYLKTQSKLDPFAVPRE